MANTAVFLGAGFVTPGDALSGDGSVLTPLDVLVDGSTIEINGSNQLEAINTTDPGGADTQVQFNDGGVFGGNAGLTYDKTGQFNVLTAGTKHYFKGADAANSVTVDGLISQVFQWGNGLSFGFEAAGDVGYADNVTMMGASLSVTLTDAASGPDITLVGEHMTVTDENGPQFYGAGFGGGGGDITVRGGQKWLALLGGNGSIVADFLEHGVALGNTITVTNADNEKAGVFLLGRSITVTNSGGAYVFGTNSTSLTDTTNAFAIGAANTIIDTAGDPVGGFAVGGGNTIDGDATFDTLYAFGHGHTLTATANQQMLIGFDGTTLPASEAVGVGVSATPEVVITAGYASMTGALKVAMQTPATAGAAGVKDTIAFDTGFIYICTADNTWKRVAIATWP